MLSDRVAPRRARRERAQGEAGPKGSAFQGRTRFRPILSSLGENKNKERKTGTIFERLMSVDPLLRSGLGWAFGQQQQQRQPLPSRSLVPLPLFCVSSVLKSPLPDSGGGLCSPGFPVVSGFSCSGVKSYSIDFYQAPPPPSSLLLYSTFIEADSDFCVLRAQCGGRQGSLAESDFSYSAA